MFQAETVLASGPALRRAHDPVAAAGDHHVMMRHHLPAKLLRGQRFRLGGRRPRRTKHDDLPDIAIRSENLGGVAQLL